jgi:hypothetical protein
MVSDGHLAVTSVTACSGYMRNDSFIIIVVVIIIIIIIVINVMIQNLPQTGP